MELPKILNRGRRWIFVRLVANGFLQALGLIATAVLIQLLFDGYVMGEGSVIDSDLILMSALLVAAAIATGLLRLFERVDAEKLGQTYIHSIRTLVFGHITSLPPRVLQNKRHGTLLLRFLGDLTAIRQWVSLGLARLAVALVLTSVTLIALSFLNLILVISVGAAVAIGTLFAAMMGRPFEKTVRDVRRRRSRLAANVNEKISAVRTVLTHAQRRNEGKKVRRQSNALARSMIHRARLIGGLRSLVYTTTSIAMASVLLVGIFEVAAGRATPGMVVAAISLVAILIPPIRDLGRVYEYWQGAKVSQEKLMNLLELGPTIEQAPKALGLSRGKGAIEFRDISVKGVLRHVSARAEPGSLVAIIGPNGTGKSTLFELLLRLMEPDSGTITIDGRDIAQLRLGVLRRFVGIVSSEVPLLRGSVEENLTYGTTNKSAAEIREILSGYGLFEPLMALPQGLKTHVTEAGTNLSVGQRQLVALARAFVNQPKILLLDEADANLDEPTGAAFRFAVSEFDGTILMITHNDEWLSVVDAIWDTRGGKLTVERLANKVLPFRAV